MSLSRRQKLGLSPGQARPHKSWQHKFTNSGHTNPGSINPQTQSRPTLAMPAWAPLLLLLSPLAKGLDLEAAKSEGKFLPIQIGNQFTQLDPWKSPSVSMSWDIDQPGEGWAHNDAEIQIASRAFFDSDFKIGLSLLLLQLDTSSNTTSIEVVTTMLGGELHPFNKTGCNQNSCHQKTVVDRDIELPTAAIEERNIFRTWEIFPDDDFDEVSLTVFIRNLTSSSKVYLTATSYRVARTSSQETKCEGFRPLKDPEWWNCNVNDQEAAPLCVNYHLTCDHLPHCAHTQIPNPDENCDSQYGLRQALQLLIYTLVTVCVIIFVAGCARCCLRGAARRQLLRRGSDMSEILAAEVREPVRPDNAPPTYDDAMKFVNDAFALEQEEGDAPPTYSPQPREGEEGGLSFSISPPSCFCSQQGDRRQEQEQDQDQEQAQETEQEGAVGFSDNFATMDMSSLPKDPPPYVR